ncbi:MAG: response regulator transcription factor [Planctomycetes bacterium]|nr:response regulator transcription factor [Planctomycetota bacterium]
MSRIRVLLARSAHTARARVPDLFRHAADVHLVADAPSIQEAVLLAHRLRPQVLVVDVPARGLEVLTLAGRVADLPTPVRILLRSPDASTEFILQALRAGAHGYMLGDAKAEDFLYALRAVMAGHTYICPRVTRKVLDALFRRSRPLIEAPANLTPRLVQVLRYVAEGNSSKEIARELGVGTKTVEAHRTRLMDTLQIRDIAGLTRYAIRIGLVRADA